MQIIPISRSFWNLKSYKSHKDMNIDTSHFYWWMNSIYPQYFECTGKIFPWLCSSLSFVWSTLLYIKNTMAPGGSQCDFKNIIFDLALLIDIFKSSYDYVLKWMPQDLTDDKSTLVQAMAWCRQATSHYLNQCWPRSPTPYGATRPQWVKELWCTPRIHQCHVIEK